jgi:cystinosin
LWVLAIIIASIELGGKMPHAKNWNGCLFLGYLKVVVTLTKYMPQVYLNYSRKSTVGWSIENVLLDFTGGMLSILQIFVDGANTGDWNVFGDGGAFNIAKFCLGFISIIFDIIFMLQHYVFYRHKPTHKESWENPLIPMDDTNSKTRV